MLNNSTCWYDAVYSDFQAICEIVGITLRTRAAARTGPQATAETPCVWFSGFCHQGAGACFEGTWEYARGSRRRIREHAPQDKRLHAIADALSAVQRPNLYELGTGIRHHGHYYHEYCMQIDIYRNSERTQEPTDGAAEAVTEAMRELARWLYRSLEAEYENEASDTTIDETLRANEWAFTSNGAFFPF